MKVSKEQQLEQDIISILPPSLHKTVQTLLDDEQTHSLQKAANAVSIKRLGYTDHGPVHMRQVTYNALLIADLLHQAGVPLTLEKEESGSYEDSLLVLVLTGMLHDIGMAIARDGHERYSCWLNDDILRRLLLLHYGEEGSFTYQCMRTMVHECIIGHMGTIRTYSLESGIILIADGCDMARGRARVPMIMSTSNRPGDIHMFSSLAIDTIVIEKGEQKPIHIKAYMSESVGFFQIEEVLFPKINMSTAKDFIELTALVTGQPERKYL